MRFLLWEYSLFMNLFVFFGEGVCVGGYCVLCVSWMIWGMMVGIEFGDEEKGREKKFESEMRIYRVFVFFWWGVVWRGDWREERKIWEFLFCD